ncbi:ATP-binding protein [Aquihabitans daechungensis]|uniref:ATP-binding protein n=1 Tax=Aquihabitans daechungensis TaxID=1052257 RepID=UPI003B9DE052
MDADPALTLPRVARTFVRGCSEMLDAVATETVLLLTSEMVTNSVQHAQTERVHVTLERVGSSLRVGVTDDDPEPPVLRDRDDGRIGGLGIQMVARMASAWGVESHEAAGKRVWFEVDAT